VKVLAVLVTAVTVGCVPGYEHLPFVLRLPIMAVATVVTFAAASASRRKPVNDKQEQEAE
jgi:hypothetical protein